MQLAECTRMPLGGRQILPGFLAALVESDIMALLPSWQQEGAERISSQVSLCRWPRASPYYICRWLDRHGKGR